MLIWLFSGGSKHSKRHAITGKPAVVVVTVFDDNDDSVYHKNIRENRVQYAEKHGKAPGIPSSLDQTP